MQIPIDRNPAGNLLFSPGWKITISALFYWTRSRTHGTAYKHKCTAWQVVPLNFFIPWHEPKCWTDYKPKLATNSKMSAHPLILCWILYPATVQKGPHHCTRQTNNYKRFNTCFMSQSCLKKVLLAPNSISKVAMLAERYTKSPNLAENCNYTVYLSAQRHATH